jgi:hypothetical protein
MRDFDKEAPWLMPRNIFSHSAEKEQASAAPPGSLEKIPWNEVVNECYDKELRFIHPVAKVIYSDDRSERAVILKKSGALFTVVFERLHPLNEDELKCLAPPALHGFWGSYGGRKSVFDSEANASNAIFSEPPFSHNKSILWAGSSFRIDAERLHWITGDDAGGPDDLRLHGHVFAKIGGEILEHDAAVSAAGLYLLRTLTDNHVIHDGQAMLPCRGRFTADNDDLSSSDIGGCLNGADWSVIHEDAGVILVTASGKETFVDMDNYREEVCAFADKVEEFYKKSSPKNLPESESFLRGGYAAFWNEWRRRRGV